MSPATAITLGSVPATFMLLFTFIGLGCKVPPTVAGALQHFAAGILLCTIATELLPSMVNATGWEENLASGVGFFLGVALLIGLGVVMPDTEGDGDDDEEDGDGQGEGVPAISSAATAESPRVEMTRREESALLGRRRCSLKAAAYRTQSPTASEPAATAAIPTAVAEETSILLSNSKAAGMITPGKKPFPTALVIAIAIDSILDGLLIGIAVAAGPSAGPMMSASLTVEMSFLGLTLATALHGHPARLSLPAAFLGPAAILIGATAGGMLAVSLGNDPVLLVGMLSFGTSALLFMVAEELLLEAHDDGDHCWWVDLQLYTGFFVSVVTGKLVPGRE